VKKKEMKYVLFFEGPLARGKLSSRSPEESAKRSEARKDEKKYGKTILEAHYYATGKGIAIVEFDNYKQIANRMALGEPEIIYQICPLIPGTDMGEASQAHSK